MTRYVSPLRYPGGKARMHAWLTEMFRAQASTMPIEIWIEPFAGGAGAGLTMLAGEVVDELWLTEKNPGLAGFWRAITRHNEELARMVASTTPTLRLWEESKLVIACAEAGERIPDLELGYAAFIVNRCSRSGIIAPSAGPLGGKHQLGTTINARFTPRALAERIQRLAPLASRIRITEGDAIRAITDLRGSGIEEEVVVFVDPPYIREGNRLYAHGMREHDHRRLAEALEQCPARWMLTYDNEPIVPRELYPHHRVLTYDIRVSANRHRRKTELAVFSDNLAVPAETSLLPSMGSCWMRKHAA